MNAVVIWEKAQWMSKHEILKRVKSLVHTCLSFGVELIVIDFDNSLSELNVSFPLSIYSKLSQVDFNDEVYLLEPLEATDGKFLSTNLINLKYKEDVTFVIGSNYRTLYPTDALGAKYLHIPTIGNHPLWQDVALGILLYDMENKKWQ